ncbi:MAG: biotin transporter BioY [Pseudomonadota bacterium]
MTVSTGARSLIDTLVPHERARRLAWYALLALLGTAVLALSAKVKVPLWPVDASLQTLALFTIAAAFGRRLAVATLVLYLVEGALGLPVFQGTPERGIGLAYMVGPTGGYLIGFVLAAYMVGWAADKGWDRRPFRLFGVMLVAELVLLALGALWLAYLFGFDKAFAYGVGPFIVTDLIKIALAAAIVPALWRLVRHLRPTATDDT